MGNDEKGIYQPSKNTIDYTSPLSKDPNAGVSGNTEKTLKKSNFSISNAFQSPVNQYETSYSSSLKDNSNALKNRRTFSLLERPNVQLYPKGKGNYISENVAGFKYKVNELTEKDIKEAKGIINNIRIHHWDNGSNKGHFDTTYNQYLKYDPTGAKNANIPLTDDRKNILRESHLQLGKGKVPLISTQFNSFLPNNNYKPSENAYNLKNSSIDFNPNFNKIDKTSIYMKDY